MAGPIITAMNPWDRWTPEQARAVAGAWCRQAALDASLLELVSFRQNAVFRHRGQRLSVRVYGPEDGFRKARTMVAFARYLERQRVPAIRLAPSVPDQPLEVQGIPVSIWEWVDVPDGQVLDYHAVGELIRRLHDRSPGFDAPLAPFDPLGRIAQRLARIREEARLDAASIAILDASLSRVAGAAHGALDPAGTQDVVVHGDALIGNVLAARAGPLLIDLDSIVRAPRSWDLAPTLVAVRHYGLPPRDWRAFLAGYRAQPGDRVDIEVMATVKALSITVALALSAGRARTMDRELAHRIDGWAQWDLGRRWHHPGRV